MKLLKITARSVGLVTLLVWSVVCVAQYTGGNGSFDGDSSNRLSLPTPTATPTSTATPTRVASN